MTTERDFEQDIIRRFDNWTLYLHDNQSYLGRTYIALNRGDESIDLDPFTDTTIDERDELTLIASGLKQSLDELYQPTRLNYANLRNLWNHCHWHVVPRYEGPNNGLRLVAGFSFYDLNVGNNFAPAPEVEVPDDVFQAIKQDLTTKLAGVI